MNDKFIQNVHNNLAKAKGQFMTTSKGRASADSVKHDLSKQEQLSKIHNSIAELYTEFDLKYVQDKMMNEDRIDPGIMKHVQDYN